MKTRGMRKLAVGLATAVAVLLASTALAAETVHLYLKVNGTDVQGESTKVSLGRENSIECLQFNQEISTQGKGDGDANGLARYGPITCVKRIDKSSPLLIKALAEGQPVEAAFKFFRPSPTGDGTTQQFYTITIDDARVTNYRLFVPDTLDPNASALPPMEEVTFAYRTVSWAYTSGNTTIEVGYGNAGNDGVRKEGDKDRSNEATGYKLEGEGEKGYVVLNWHEPEARQAVVGYQIFRSTDEKGVVTADDQFTDVPIEDTHYKVKMSPGTYFFAVQAVLKDGTTLDISQAVKIVVE